MLLSTRCLFAGRWYAQRPAKHRSLTHALCCVTTRVTSGTDRNVRPGVPGSYAVRSPSSNPLHGSALCLNRLYLVQKADGAAKEPSRWLRWLHSRQPTAEVARRLLTNSPPQCPCPMNPQHLQNLRRSRVRRLPRMKRVTSPRCRRRVELPRSWCLCMGFPPMCRCRCRCHPKRVAPMPMKARPTRRRKRPSRHDELYPCPFTVVHLAERTPTP
jgi:hypothetical protein